MTRTQDDKVLAFLLGATPMLDATSAVDTVETEDDPPELEPVSDCDDEGSSNLNEIKDESGQPSASDAALDTVEYPLVEIDDSVRKQNAGEICREDSGVEGNNKEAEHEDDCNASIKNVAIQQPNQSKKKTQMQQKPSSDIVKVNSIKSRRGSARSTKAVPPVTMRESLSMETKLERDSNTPTFEEVLFVGCVVVVLVAYLVACVYSFFHPLVMPLPDHEKLYSPYDISNVSVCIVNPEENAQITPQGVLFEWKLANFPKEALHLYGAEVFRYRVSLDNEVIASEIEFLTIEENDEAKILNRTVRFPIPLRSFSRDENDEADRLFKLHLEVTIPIPGLIEELKTFEDEVYVQKPPTPSPEDGVHLTLTSPLNDTIFELNQSIVLEYTVVNVVNIEVVLDDDIYVKKSHVADGNMLLRGLGAGPHKFEIRGLNDQNDIVAVSTVEVHVQ
ncbi:Hypothetical protein PHPALM_16156 [Phytophthora palmivora]|uniref:Transmembrane protein n=1 Tax=Phytophthora palmivora TaxID=4796 RepID=A0A2P4XQE0_9STRA|nr:Hypothetical protein PHPALM_16156 [Phytophthora palmivora]